MDSGLINSFFFNFGYISSINLTLAYSIILAYYNIIVVVVVVVVAAAAAAIGFNITDDSEDMTFVLEYFMELHSDCIDQNKHLN